MRQSLRALTLLSLILGVSLVILSCQAQQAAPEVRVETKTVKETVVVEKVVEKPVEKVVEKVSQVVVTATPAPSKQLQVDIPLRKDGNPAPAEKQVFRFDYPGDFWPDPFSLGVWFADIGTLVNAGLVTETLDGKIRPELAEKWDVSADGMTYTFTLNKNAKFSDGSPITVDDVIFSLSTMLDPKGSTDPLYRSSYLSIKGYQNYIDGKATSVEGLKAQGDNQVVITLDKPLPWFPTTLGFWQARIAQKKNVEAGGKEWWRTPVTSGMYKVARFDYGQRNYMELVPNEYYVLGPKPKLQKIIIERVTDPSTRLTRYLNNETDALYYPEPADVAAALRGGQLKDDLLGSAIAGQWYFYFRHDRAPFDDKKVRQAFIMATDVDKLSRSVLEGTLVKQKSIIPRTSACFKDVDNSLPYDPVKAKQLLAESKYAGKVPDIRFFVSEVLGTPTIGRWTRVATAMAAMWAENLEVPVKIQTKEFEFEDKKEGAFQIARSSRSPLTLDAAALSLWYGKGASTADQSKYSNPEVEATLAQADVEKDQAKRCELY
ncbi:MAG: ABC transporter substrate-binding protein, partial [Anaerolineae bacterium]|nr:ABC transporter substrate-binding protein [Anaerolineae bacterium]